MMEIYMKLNNNELSKINLNSARKNMDIENIFVSDKYLECYENYKEFFPNKIQIFLEYSENIEISLNERIKFASILSLLGDPRIQTMNPKMEKIPSATINIGLNYESLNDVYENYKYLGVEKEWIEKECPKHSIEIDTFFAGKYLVTNFEYLCFLKENPLAELPTSWDLGLYPIHKSNHPVYTISLNSAYEYIKWLNTKTNEKYRLLSEYEWEYLASNGKMFEFPWGNQFNKNYCNTLEAKYYSTTPVGVFTEGNNEFGICDLAGNVEEYVSNSYFVYPNGKLILDDLYKITNSPYPMTRGGSFTRSCDLARSKRRHGYFPGEIYVIGFRLAKDGV
ncbi:SUMF1/EgtB/PvdO family nonheme iron enzyme [Silvanigrella paludirubra]|uniref:SUMF1/EgtB/PvdO family nonheme iron enzyme n=2 Tax=Silvanigrella paludirubra TaxID=2499159 RepID=A0A6N6VQ26_9BACT|nr:SUMF1/EgtB/PvdO family nonheme iron enzyme [Silvanigrella paludirubra]